MRAIRVHDAPGPVSAVMQPSHGPEPGSQPGLEHRPTGRQVCGLLGPQLALLRKLLQLLHKPVGSLLVLLAQLLPDGIVG